MNMEAMFLLLSAVKMQPSKEIAYPPSLPPIHSISKHMSEWKPSILAKMWRSRYFPTLLGCCAIVWAGKCPSPGGLNSLCSDASTALCWEEVESLGCQASLEKAGQWPWRWHLVPDLLLFLSLSFCILSILGYTFPTLWSSVLSWGKNSLSQGL